MPFCRRRDNKSRFPYAWYWRGKSLRKGEDQGEFITPVCMDLPREREHQSLDPPYASVNRSHHHHPHPRRHHHRPSDHVRRAENNTKTDNRRRYILRELDVRLGIMARKYYIATLASIMGIRRRSPSPPGNLNRRCLVLCICSLSIVGPVRHVGSIIIRASVICDAVVRSVSAAMAASSRRIMLYRGISGTQMNLTM
ncbi:uncharacterized protein ATNIH1004_008362 [Aspergillus tanneri]|uniref:Uncharacterized protein n=1 Tax=Aspergillus tanneri TaxID=1220188 RepID=A0A5M9MGQ6_9EURO|nr:uncharacterized protein ATNIH1004_008362 [Aspergillus tanneri]KAA8644163.1 hypothetical protein ATNIH1004_008362 [Aspergillus tanneri]